MLVLVSLDAGNPRVAIADRENLNQLHVEFRGIDDTTAGEGHSADGIVSMEGDHVWLDIAKLRAVGDASDDWSDRFDAMVRYAQRNDWLDEQGMRVRAHVVRD